MRFRASLIALALAMGFATASVAVADDVSDARTLKLSRKLLSPF